MKGYKIFLAWLFTVILGSIGLPLWFLIIDGSFYSRANSYMIRDLPGLILISIIVSAILSLPTVLTLIIRNEILKKKKLSIKVCLRKINYTHVFMAFLTVFVAAVAVFVSEFENYTNYKRINTSYQYNLDLLPILYMTLVVVWYMICAFPFWYFLFKSDIKNSRTPAAFEEKSIELNPEN